MANTTNITTVSGTVEQTNKTGVKLDSGQWFNYSQYGYRGPEGNPPSPAPAVGSHVTLKLKNDKFIDSLTYNLTGGQAAPQQAAPSQHPNSVSTPAAVTFGPSTHDIALMSVDARQTLLKTLALAQPGMFTLENMDTLTEIVRNLEQFVLEDIMPRQEEDVTEEDLLDEDADI